MPDPKAIPTFPAEDGWTFDTLLFHVDSRLDSIFELIKTNDERYTERRTAADDAIRAAFAAQTSAMTAALAAADRAVAKAEAASEKRFDSVNEFRSTLSDQQRTLMPRKETELLFEGMKAMLNELTRQISELSKSVSIHQQAETTLRSTKSDSWKDIIMYLSIAAAVIAILTRFIP